MMTLCLDIQSTDKPGHSTPATSPTTAMTQMTDVTATTASMLFSFHMRDSLGANPNVRQHASVYFGIREPYWRTVSGASRLLGLMSALPPKRTFLCSCVRSKLLTGGQ
jgi:hypothetical protein